MRTYKPVSTISYVPPKTLALLLETLKKKGTLSFYSFIVHKPEKEGLKEHSHIYVEPYEQIETDALRKFLETPEGGTEPFRKSKTFDEWFLYGCHHPDYLRSKGKPEKVYTYQPFEFESSDENEFNERVDGVNMFDILSPMEKVMYCRTHGLTVYQAMAKCRVSYGAMTSFLKVWSAMDETERISAIHTTDNTPTPEKTFRSKYFLDYRTGWSWERVNDSEYYTCNMTDEVLTKESILMREWKQ